MKEKKYIDRLYQEKFRDFEAAPRDAVWKSIEAKLQEKQKRKAAVPLWYRYAGVAAIFAFLLMLGDWILPAPPSAAVVNEETKDSNTKPLTSPFVSPVITGSLAEETEVAENSSAISRDRPSPVVDLINRNSEQRKSEKTASKLSSKNAIFDTPVLAAVTQLKKEETNPVSEELKPSIFDALQPAEEEEIAANQHENMLEVSTHAAPIYYGKMGSANPLDVGYNDSREAEVTYSYGVRLALNISDKVKIRSGVSRVDLSYSSSGLGYRSASGIYPVRNASLVNVKDSEVKMVTAEVPTRTRSSADRTPAGVFTQGNLNQKIGYIEVPVEFELNLLEKKFEINIIGGGSTLFLKENEVTLTTGDISAAGKANNLNKISFSANLGLGLDYNLSEKFKLNFEPMFKYQLKTFENPNGKVQPYFMGVYTGFSYKF